MAKKYWKVTCTFETVVAAETEEEAFNAAQDDICAYDPDERIVEITAEEAAEFGYHAPKSDDKDGE